MNNVANFKKISLSFQAGSTPDTMDIELQAADYDIIYGIASEGLTPFEYELTGKSEGDEVAVHVKNEHACEFFGYFYELLWELHYKRPEIYLRVKIEKILPAENREIVKAMAKSTAHGSSCNGDCGCGCGGH